mmetsp:Transcript_8616/g.35470  ORF Transcript_8616/g.35470 Transcript_8616/m.35470 type:complete len:269 (+) Transcript_8616:2828-3634(+)
METYLKSKYRNIVGGVQFPSATCRPDITYEVGRAARKVNDPSREAIARLAHLVRYVNDNRTRCLKYSRNGTSQEYLRQLSPVTTWVGKPQEPEPVDVDHAVGLVDANFAPADEPLRRSTSGTVFMYKGNTISWKSKLQYLTAGSTHDAELIAASLAADEASWLHQLINELHSIFYRNRENPERPVKLHGDNLAACFTANNPTTSSRSRHLDVRFFKIRDCIAAKKLVFAHIDGKFNVADFFTKPHGRNLFDQFMAHLGMESPVANRDT